MQARGWVIGRGSGLTEGNEGNQAWAQSSNLTFSFPARGQVNPGDARGKWRGEVAAAVDFENGKGFAKSLIIGGDASDELKVAFFQKTVPLLQFLMGCLKPGQTLLKPERPRREERSVRDQGDYENSRYEVFGFCHRCGDRLTMRVHGGKGRRKVLQKVTKKTKDMNY